MRAYQLHDLVEDPQELKLVQLTDLSPHPDKYLIRIHATAINFFDLLQIKGKHQQKPEFPWIAGNEFSGEILAVPTHTRTRDWKFRTGDRVFGAGLGAFATMIAAPEADLRAVPKGWTYAEASSLFYTAPTAYAALVLRARAKKGDYVLIHGGAGGVGLAAVAIARALGMKVIASASTKRKRDIATRYGAHFVVDAKADWVSKTRQLTPENRGVDVVLDPIGAISQSLQCIRWDGRLCIIGFAAGNIEKIPTNRLLLKNVGLSGLFWGEYSNNDPQAVVEVWDKLSKLIDERAMPPLNYTERIFTSLEEIPDALEMIGTGGAWGKIVVSIGEVGSSKL